jgi:hypothetical protein
MRVAAQLEFDPTEAAAPQLPRRRLLSPRWSWAVFSLVLYWLLLHAVAVRGVAGERQPDGDDSTPPISGQWISSAKAEAHLARVAIRRAQEPLDCATAPFILPGNGNEGFASLMVVYAKFLRYSVAQQSVMAITGRLGNYDSTGKVYHQLFQRETSCADTHYRGTMKSAYSKRCPYYVKVSNGKKCGRDNFDVEHAKFVNKTGLPSMSLDASMAHILRWLLRPTAWLASHLDTTMQSIGYPQNHGEAVIGIHIRRGDKNKPFPTKQYILAAMELTRQAMAAALTNRSIPIPSVIFLATDEADFATLEEEAAATLATDSSLQLRIVSQGSGILRKLPMLGMANYLRALSKQDSAGDEPGVGVRAAIEIATDLLLLAESDYLCGTAVSTVGMVAAFLRVGRFDEMGQRPPHRAIQIEPIETTTEIRSRTEDVVRLLMWTDTVNFDGEAGIASSSVLPASSNGRSMNEL